MSLTNDPPTPFKGKTKSKTSDEPGVIDTTPQYGPGNYAPRPPRAETTSSMRLKIESFRYHGNGEITLELPSKALDAPTMKTLKTMFPNTMEHAFDLLNREIILASIIDRDIEEESPQYEPIVASEHYPY